MSTMTVTFPGGKRVDAEYGGFVVKTDQPPQGGGEGSAPQPFDLFLASIGTCAGFYVLRFCRQRGIPIEGLKIRQRATANPSTKLIERIDIELELPPGFPEQYRDAAVRSAQLCAVKKHLENPPRIEVRTV